MENSFSPDKSHHIPKYVFSILFPVDDSKDPANSGHGNPKEISKGGFMVRLIRSPGLKKELEKKIGEIDSSDVYMAKEEDFLSILVHPSLLNELSDSIPLLMSGYRFAGINQAETKKCTCQCHQSKDKESRTEQGDKIISSSSDIDDLKFDLMDDLPVDTIEIHQDLSPLEVLKNKNLFLNSSSSDLFKDDLVIQEDIEVLPEDYSLEEVTEQSLEALLAEYPECSVYELLSMDLMPKRDSSAVTRDVENLSLDFDSK